MVYKTPLDRIAPSIRLRDLWYEVAPPIGHGGWRTVVIGARKPLSPKGTALAATVFQIQFEMQVATPYMSVVPGIFYLSFDGFQTGKISWQPPGGRRAKTQVIPFRCGTQKAGEVLAQKFFRAAGLRFRRSKTLIATPENWQDYVYYDD